MKVKQNLQAFRGFFVFFLVFFCFDEISPITKFQTANIFITPISTILVFSKAVTLLEK